MEHPSSLVVQNLELKYSESVAFSKVNFQVPSVGVSAIVGPSGSGKTSILYCLNRLIENVSEASVSGDILWKEESVFSKNCSVKQLRQSIGMIFQRPNPFPVSIYKNISMVLEEHYTLSKKEISAEVERVLSEVGLWEEVKNRLKSSALKLSGGQQQRLCIARALALKPRVLLMDEPTSSLDPIATQRVEELILHLKKSIALVLVTHNLAQAKRISDEMVVLWNQGQGGYVLEQGSTEAIFRQPTHPITADYIEGRVC